MWTKIKLYGGIAIGLLVGALYAAFRVQKSEKETALEQKEKYQSAAKESEKVIEVKNDIEKAKSDVDAASNDDVMGMLSKYDRNRKD